MDLGIRAILSGFKEAQQQFADLNKEIDKTSGSTDKLNTNSTKAGGALGGLGGQATEAAEGFSLLEKGVMLAGGALGTAFAVAATYAGKQLLEGINNVRTLGEEFHNMSQKTGIAAETLGSYQLAAQTNNLSMQQFSQGLVQFNRHISDATKGTGEAADAFGRAGVSLKDNFGNLKDTDTLLREVADAFAGMKDSAAKTDIAIQLFGRAGADLIPLLNEGAAGLAKLQEEARKAGIVIDKETAEAAAKFNANLSVLKAYGQGFWMEIASPIVEGMAKITTAMRDARREGEGFWGSLFAGAGKLGQVVTGTDTTQAELAGTTSKLQRLYQERGRVQNSPFPDTGQLRSIDQQIQLFETERNRLADVLAINNSTDYSEVPSSGGKRDAPTKAAKEKAAGAGARGPSMESQANAEARTAHDALRAGEMTRQEYIEYLDGMAESYQDYESLRLHFAAMAADERKKLMDEEGKQELTRQKAQAAADKAFLDNEDRDWILSLHTKRQIQEAEVEKDISLTHEQKAERLQAIRDELDLWTSVYPQVKKDVAELDKRIADERLATEREYQAKVKSILGNREFDITVVFQGASQNLQKTFDEMIRGHTSFKRSVNKIWQGIVDDTISEIARLGKNAVLDTVMGPMKEAFKGVGDFVKTEVFAPLWGFIKEGFKDLFQSVISGGGGVFSGVGTMFSTMIGGISSSASSILNGIVGSATDIFSGIGGALGGAFGDSSFGGFDFGGFFSGDGTVPEQDPMDIPSGDESGGDGGGFSWTNFFKSAGNALGGGGSGGAAGQPPRDASGNFTEGYGKDGWFYWQDQHTGQWRKSRSEGDAVADKDPMSSRNIGKSVGGMFGGSIGASIGEKVGDVWNDIFSFFPTGTDMVVTQPTAFVAGDAGPERVMVNPLSGAARTNMPGGGGFTNNGIMILDEYSMRRFKRQILGQ